MHSTQSFGTDSRVDALRRDGHANVLRRSKQADLLLGSFSLGGLLLGLGAGLPPGLVVLLVLLQVLVSLAVPLSALLVDVSVRRRLLVKSVSQRRRRCEQRVCISGGGSYRLVTSLLGLLLVLLGLFVASLCFCGAENVSGGVSGTSSSLKATHLTRRWTSARTETWTVTSSSSYGTPPPRTRSPDDHNDNKSVNVSDNAGGSIASGGVCVCVC